MSTEERQSTLEWISSVLRELFGNIPFKKVLVWALFLYCIYALRSFFGLIFLTFILSYITNTIVEKLLPYMKFRVLTVTLVFICLLGTIILLGIMTVPRIYEEGRHLSKSLTSDILALIREMRLDREIDSKGDEGIILPSEKAEGFFFAELYRYLRFKVGRTRLLQALDYLEIDIKLQQKLSELTTAIPGLITKFLGSILSAVGYFLLSVLFSYIIILQIPKLSRKIKALERTRLKSFYIEIIPGIKHFGNTIGKAFRAQILIALLNTLLTLIVMIVLEVPSPVFLSVLVFLLSLLPVVGFLCSTPLICLLTLGAHGPIRALECLIAVILLHAIEAYVFNPMIISARLELHPIMVFGILLVGEHFFGIWGLLLGVPTCVYIYDVLIAQTENTSLENFENTKGETT